MHLIQIEIVRGNAWNGGLNQKPYNLYKFMAYTRNDITYIYTYIHIITYIYACITNLTFKMKKNFGYIYTVNGS